MQIKKFTAPTLKEATQKMKIEMGSDAIILGTRVIEGDLKLGISKKFELTCGIETDAIDWQESEVLTNGGTDINTGQAGKSFADELKSISKKIYNRNSSQTYPEKQNFDLPLKKYIIEPDLNKKGPVSNDDKKFDFDQSGSKKETRSSQKSMRHGESISKELKEIVDTLYYREVQKSIITSIMENIKKYADFLHPTNIDGYVLSSISSLIPTKNFQIEKKQSAKIIALVGPTGVGKTTCIAKLAVISKILHNLDIGLVSIDTYRLGAIDQLKIFSEISSIELQIAYEAKEMPAILEKFKKKDIIFIDTAGRSQKNTGQLNEMKEFLSASNIEEIFLVLSSTSTTKNLFDTAERFKIFNYDSLIFTKIDEGVSFGNLLNVVANFNVPVSFLSNGQVIPDDIISADAEFIADMIYTGKITK